MDVIVVQLAIFIASLVVLLKSSDVIINSTLKITKMTKLGELVAGFIVISLATTVPEMAVSFSTILSQNVGMSIGNLLGSNVTNICLIMGLSIILAPKEFRMRSKEIKSLTSMLFLLSVIPILLLITGEVKTIVGILLIATFAYFCFYLVKEKITLERMEKIKGGNFFITTVFLVVGLFVLIVSARFVVSSAAKIAQLLGISEAVIGSTIIALGTSLPELSIVLNSARSGHINLALGNAIGACLTNLSLVLGVVLLLSPLKINMTVYSTLLFFVLICTIVMRYFLEDERLELIEGIALVVLYIIFLSVVFGVQISLLEIFQT